MGLKRNTNYSGGRRGRNRNGGRGLNKEKITMLATSLVVLSALTVTGIYIGQRNESGQDNRIIDFSSLEDQSSADAGNTGEESGLTDEFVEHDDLDVDPELYAEYRAANSEDVYNPDLAQTQEEGEEHEDDTSESMSSMTDAEEASAENIAGEEASAQSSAPVSQADVAEAVIAQARETLIFDEGQSLAWPVVGNVVINYSMDSYVYFATLGQYKYSPAIVISAVEGENITAAANGVVSDVFYDDEIGNAVTMVLGSGYELTYGQLDNIQVSAGDIVNRGDLIGTVAAPTKYYSLEGTNVYFRMTKDGTPVNPLTLLQ